MCKLKYWIQEDGFSETWANMICESCPTSIKYYKGLLIWSIVGKWIEEVKKELEQNPLTEEEIQKAFRYAEEYKKGHNTERMYGTILIADLQTERYLLFLQQGDGRCFSMVVLISLVRRRNQYEKRGFNICPAKISGSD